MAAQLDQWPLPQRNPFLERVVLAPTVPQARQWQYADNTFFQRVTEHELIDTELATKGRVAMYTFTQHQHYLSGRMKEVYKLENVISERVEILEKLQMSDNNHWAHDAANANRVTTQRASLICDKRKDHVKREMFGALLAGVQRTVATMGGVTIWTQSSPQDRITIFDRLFDEDPLEMAKLSAGNVVAKRTIDFDALYHHEEMLTDAADDLAGYMREWIRYKFSRSCEIIFQKYIVDGSKSAIGDATGAWRALWTTWVKDVKHLNEDLLIPENWPSL